MKHRVVTLPDAERDALAALAWISQAAPDTALRWFDGLEAAIATLSTFPRRCVMAPEAVVLGKEIRQLLYKSYRILFTIEHGTVYILHIRHTSRDLWRPGPLGPE